jgi:acyl-CoA thioester hydrolase
MIRKSQFRVYYEDTDMAGIVYYANYLKFMERGRSDAVRAMGIDQTSLKDIHGIVFAVRHVAIDFHSPARFDDVLTVSTRTLRAGGASLEMAQEIHVGPRLIVGATVRIAAMTLAGGVARLPAEVRAQLAE